MHTTYTLKSIHVQLVLSFVLHLGQTQVNPASKYRFKQIIGLDSQKNGMCYQLFNNAEPVEAVGLVGCKSDLRYVS